MSTATGGTLLESRLKMDAKSACVKGREMSSAQRKSARTIDLCKYLLVKKHQLNLGKGGGGWGTRTCYKFKCIIFMGLHIFEMIFFMNVNINT